MDTTVTVRSAARTDCEAIAAIYDEGIREGRATFETQMRSSADVARWLAPRMPVLVAEADGAILGWARVSGYSGRPCYAGIAEAGVYVCTSARGGGVCAALATELRARAEADRYHKVLGKLLAGKDAGRHLAARVGFREVGVHLRHGAIDGRWHDVLVVELLRGGTVQDLGG